MQWTFKYRRNWNKMYINIFKSYTPKRWQYHNTCTAPFTVNISQQVSYERYYHCLSHFKWSPQNFNPGPIKTLESNFQTWWQIKTRQIEIVSNNTDPVDLYDLDTKIIVVANGHLLKHCLFKWIQSIQTSNCLFVWLGSTSHRHGKCHMMAMFQLYGWGIISITNRHLRKTTDVP
jgi:hypothetical protein